MCVFVCSCMRSFVSPSVYGSANWPSSIAQATVILLWWRPSGWTLLRVNWWLVRQSVPTIWWRCLWARWRPSVRSTLARRAASLSVSTVILVNAGVTLLLRTRFLQENRLSGQQVGIDMFCVCVFPQFCVLFCCFFISLPNMHAKLHKVADLSRLCFLISC